MPGSGAEPQFRGGAGWGEQSAAGVTVRRVPFGTRGRCGGFPLPAPLQGLSASGRRGLGRSLSFGKGRGGEQPAAGVTIRRTYPLRHRGQGRGLPDAETMP
ncbi:hypothetical protein GCM10009576_061990 [Streptomyces rhizosphaericus]|uniref:Uncharacterized protein n=1 Tax=Streptomyces rhizosphaericus TaxID=114699 RepID=A0ABN1SH74_9ACTN